MTSVNALREARTRLAEQRYEVALAQLLDAWCQRPDPRVATLIDAVDDLAPHSDLRSVWPSSWPPDWQRALAGLQQLIAWPRDPRLAKRLAQEVAEPRYALGTAARLYRPMLDAIARSGDTRCREILASMPKEALPKPYLKAIRVALQRTMHALETVSSQDAEAAELREIEVIEQLLSRHGAARVNIERDARELLDAIHEDLDDDERRALYADYLLAQGDPLGELVTIQLRERTVSGVEASALEARKSALIEKYGRVWAGDLGPYFERQLVFERGLFAGGLVHQALPPERLRHSRAWRSLRYIDLGSSAEDPADLLALDLHTLLGLAARRIGLLLESACARTVVELGLRDLQGVPELDLLRLCQADALPHVRKLHLPSEFVAALRGSALLARLEEVVTDYVQPWAGLPRDEAPALRRVHVWLAPSYQRASWSFHVTLQRDGVSVEARLDPRPFGRADALAGLSAFIWTLPPSSLKALTIVDCPRLRAVPFHERARLNAALASASRLEQVSSPWADVVARPRVELTRRRALQIELIGPSLLDARRLAIALEALSALDPSARDLLLPEGSCAPLGADPLAACALAARSASSMTLLRDEFDGPCFTLSSQRFTTSSDVAGSRLIVAGDTEADLLRLRDWLFDWAERLEVHHARIVTSHQTSERPIEHRETEVRVYQDGLSLGAPKLFIGSHLAPFLADSELPSGYEVTRRGALLYLDRGPLDVTLEEEARERSARAFEQALPHVFERKWGYAPAELLAAVVGPVLAHRDFTLRFAHDFADGWRVRLGEDVCVALRIHDPLFAPQLSAALECRIGAGASEALQPKGGPSYYPAATREQAQDALVTIARLADLAYPRIERSWAF